MILLGKLEVNGKQFTMQDSIGTVYLKSLGYPDSFYGGYVKEARKTKFGIYMLVNDGGVIVNLGYTEDSLTEAGAELLGLGVEEVEKEEPIEEKQPIKVAIQNATKTSTPLIKSTPPVIKPPVAGRGRPKK